MCEPSQTNASPHYIDLTEVDSYQLKLNGYKSLLGECGTAEEWCDLTCTSQFTDCNILQQYSTRKISFFFPQGISSPLHLILPVPKEHGKSKWEDKVINAIINLLSLYMLDQFMGKEEVDVQMTEESETWFSGMAWTCVGAQTELSKNGNICPKVLWIFLKVSAIRANTHDGGKKTGMVKGWAKQRGERDVGIGLTWAAPAACGRRPPWGTAGFSWENSLFLPDKRTGSSPSALPAHPCEQAIYKYVNHIYHMKTFKSAIPNTGIRCWAGERIWITLPSFRPNKPWWIDGQYPNT